MNTPNDSRPLQPPTEAETDRAPKLDLVHGSAGLVVRLRALADDDRYAPDEWSEEILRQAANEIERMRAAFEAIIVGNYAPGAERAHPAVALARATLSPNDPAHTQKGWERGPDSTQD